MGAAVAPVSDVPVMRRGRGGQAQGRGAANTAMARQHSDSDTDKTNNVSLDKPALYASESEQNKSL